MQLDGNLDSIKGIPLHFLKIPGDMDSNDIIIVSYLCKWSIDSFLYW